MERRGFIGGALAIAVANVLGERHPMRASRARMSFGYASITWNGNDRAAIDDIAALGFKGIQMRTAAVETWANRPTELKQLLAARQLEFVALSSGTIGLAPEREASDLALHVKHAQFARDAGCRYLQIIDERPQGRAPVSDDFRRMGKLLTELGKRTADLGIPLGYHNHMGALGQSPDEVARVMDATDPRYVKMELDIAHYQAAGGDPVEGVKRYADRLLFVHIKDLQRPKPGGTPDSYRFVELGRGSVNVPAVLAALNAARFGGWAIVELDAVPDSARTPKESGMIARQFLESNGYTI